MENTTYKDIFENENFNFKKSVLSQTQFKLFIDFEKNINYYLNLVKYNLDIDYTLNIFNTKIKSIIKYNKDNIEISRDNKLLKYTLINIHNECYIHILKYMHELEYNDFFYTKNSYTLNQVNQYKLLIKKFNNFSSDFIVLGNIGLIIQIQNKILKLLLSPKKNTKTILDNFFDISNLCTLSLSLIFYVN